MESGATQTASPLSCFGQSVITARGKKEKKYHVIIG